MIPPFAGHSQREGRKALNWRDNVSERSAATGYIETPRRANAFCWIGVGLVSTVSG
jgi:hypothetical protein